MRLILKVLLYKGSPVFPEKIVEFSRQGGYIGRHAGNTLTLEDADKIVSGRHAEISFENGQFWIKDVSTNGTYLTNADLNLNNSKAVLNHNEVLRLGEYEIKAEIASELSSDREFGFDKAISSPFNDTFNGPFDSNPFDIGSFPLTAEPLNAETADFRNESPIHDSFSMPDVMSTEKPVKDITDYLKGLDSLCAVAAPSASASVEQEAPFKEAGPELFATDRPSPQPGLKFQSADTPVFKGPKPSQAASGIDTLPTARDTANNGQLIRQFLKGAGIHDDAFIPAGESAAVMNAAGALFRGLVEGLMDVLRARAEMKSEFRVSVTTLRSSRNNPLKFNPEVENVLKLLLGPPNPAFIGAKDAVDEAFRDIKYHQIAMTAAIQASLTEILDKFNPEGIEKVYSEGVVFHKKAKCWELFCEKYPEYRTQALEEFFGDAFADAYEKQMRQFGKP